MTDTELDELLDKWTAPSAPPSMRDRVRAGFPARAATEITLARGSLGCSKLFFRPRYFSC